MNIAMINTVQPNCGVYQYGLRVKQNLGDLITSYHEIETMGDYTALDLSDAELVLFNYIRTGAPDGPLAWLDDWHLARLRMQGKIPCQLYHAFPTLQFDYYFHQSPIWNNTDKVFSLPRPLPEPATSDPEMPDVPVVGSFGLANDDKNFPKIIRLVSDQFAKAKVRINFTNGYYGDASGETAKRIHDECVSTTIHSGIELEITNRFLPESQMVEFLRGNDLNVFMYYHDGFGGISSVIDYAIAARRPFAIGTSNMFDHIYRDEICLDRTTLPNIIEYGSKYVDELVDRYSPDAMRSAFSDALRIIERNRYATN